MLDRRSTDRHGRVRSSYYSSGWHQVGHRLSDAIRTKCIRSIRGYKRRIPLHLHHLAIAVLVHPHLALRTEGLPQKTARYSVLWNPYPCRLHRVNAGSLCVGGVCVVWPQEGVGCRAGGFSSGSAGSFVRLATDTCSVQGFLFYLLQGYFREEEQ